MKWYRVVLLLVLLGLSFFALAEQSGDPINVYVMPSALRIIEDEAFKSTNGDVVILPDATTHIHEQAFAENPRLKVIYIPSTTVYIADDAFSHSGNVSIFGVLGSYAHKWAQKQGIRFYDLDIWYMANPVGVIHRIKNRLRSEIKQTDVGLKSDEDPSDRHDLHPKEKPGMHPIDYDFP